MTYIVSGGALNSTVVQCTSTWLATGGAENAGVDSRGIATDELNR